MFCLLYAILIGKQCWDSPSIERWDANDPKINKTLLTNDLNKIVNKFKLNIVKLNQDQNMLKLQKFKL